jgi:hypothetical protein
VLLRSLHHGDVTPDVLHCLRTPKERQVMQRVVLLAMFSLP